MKIESIPKRGRKDGVIYSETRHGKVARKFVPPHNPRTAQQQAHRRNVRAVLGRWGTLPKANWAIWIRVCQHIDGYTDVPKVLRFRLPAAVA